MTKLKITKAVFIISLAYVSMFYSAALDTDKMIFYYFPNFVGSQTLYLFIIIIPMLISLLRINKLKIYRIDLLFFIFTTLFIFIILKNYTESGSTRLLTTIFYIYFYFIGRLIYYSKNIRLMSLVNVMYFVAIMHIIVSILKLVAERYDLGQQLLLVGSDIGGSNYLGAFNGRASGLFFSPLTLSGFLVIPFFLGLYSFIYGNKYYKFVFIIIFIGIALTLSRGTVISIIFGIFMLVLLSNIKLKLKAIPKTFFKILISSLFILILLSQAVSLQRFYDESTIVSSGGIRISVLLRDIALFISDYSNIFFGSSNYQLGSDNDFMSLLFTIGIPLMVLLSVIVFKLTYEISSNNKISFYFAAGIFAKFIESNIAGSSWGPPSSFFIFLILGYLYTEKKEMIRNKNMEKYLKKHKKRFS